MADEIQVEAVTGLTVTVQVYSGIIPVGGAISLVEAGTTGNYIGDMSPTTPYGHYLLVATAVGGDNPVIGSGEIMWDGAYEMPVGLSMLQGLDPNNQMSVTPTERKTGAIDLTIGGDGETISTVQRV